MSKGIRTRDGLWLWAEFCKQFGHYFRADGTCVCGQRAKKGDRRA